MFTTKTVLFLFLCYGSLVLKKNKTKQQTEDKKVKNFSLFQIFPAPERKNVAASSKGVYYIKCVSK